MYCTVCHTMSRMSDATKLSLNASLDLVKFALSKQHYCSYKEGEIILRLLQHGQTLGEQAPSKHFSHQQLYKIYDFYQKIPSYFLVMFIDTKVNWLSTHLTNTNCLPLVFHFVSFSTELSHKISNCIQYGTTRKPSPLHVNCPPLSD